MIIQITFWTQHANNNSLRIAYILYEECEHEKREGFRCLRLMRFWHANLAVIMIWGCFEFLSICWEMRIYHQKTEERPQCFVTDVYVCLNGTLCPWQEEIRVFAGIQHANFTGSNWDIVLMRHEMDARKEETYPFRDGGQSRRVVFPSFFIIAMRLDMPRLGLKCGRNGGSCYENVLYLPCSHIHTSRPISFLPFAGLFSLNFFERYVWLVFGLSIYYVLCPRS